MQELSQQHRINATPQNVHHIGFWQEVNLRFKAMFALQPVIPSLMGVAILLAVWAIANSQLSHSWAHDYLQYINWGIGIGLGLNVFRSASMSVVLPVAFVVIGLGWAHFSHLHVLQFHLNQHLATWMVLIGVVSLIKIGWLFG